MTTRSDQNRLILRGVLTLVAAIVAVWVLYELRGVLILISVSTLLAMGFSPIVRSLERRRQFRLPRWAAMCAACSSWLSRRSRCAACERLCAASITDALLTAFTR